MGIKHAKVISIADGPDTTKARPGDWNANHVIEAGTIVNADVSASAAIAKTKLAALSIGNDDVYAAAAIVESKLLFNTTSGHRHDGVSSRPAKHLQESSGPTTLEVGAVSDGDHLIRSGSTLIGSKQRNITSPSSDHSAVGDVDTITAGENLVAGSLLYQKPSDGKYYKSNSGALATMPASRMALATISADASGLALIRGKFRDDSYSWTINSLLYASGTSGQLTSTIPSASGSQVQIIARAVSATIIDFNPCLVLVEVA